jgi:arsenate reductase
MTTMAKVTIYHNPRCSKSRQTLALLEERDLDLKVIPYLDEPPSAAALQKICKRLGIPPQDLIRRKEKRFRELGLSASDRRSAGEWCKIMAENPILMERPIAVQGKKAALGRPPENVLSIL